MSRWDRAQMGEHHQGAETMTKSPPCLRGQNLSLQSADRSGWEMFLCRACLTVALRRPSGWIWVRVDGVRYGSLATTTITACQGTGALLKRAFRVPLRGY